MSSKINLQPCEYARKSSIFQDNQLIYYTTMYKNGKMYNLEVLYDEISNTVYHFEYARKAMGNLPAIPK